MKLPHLLQFLHPSRKPLVWKIAGISLALALLFFLLFALSTLGEINDLGIRKLTGFPGGNNYLLVFQNDAERRPTGGFITAYGILKFRFGIPFISFGNVYDPKLIQPGEVSPDPTIASLLAGDFFPGNGFRDGNYSPDFPTSAQELMRLYHLGYPDTNFDGVIAVDFTAFENLAKVVAPEVLGETGLFSAIETKVQDIDLHNPDELAERKNFLGDLAKYLIRKIITSPGKYSLAAESIVSSLDSKHLQMYFTDSEMESRAKTKAWDGSLPTVASGDLLAVVEGNYGGMKSSRYLIRDVDYSVEVADSENGLQPTAHLKISLKHWGDAAEPISGYYKGFFRVYAPLGAELISGKIDRFYDDGLHSVYEKIIQMNPGEEREINLTYTLPESVIVGDTYKLKIVKQAGSSDDRIRAIVKLPHGYLTSSSEFEARENLAFFQTDIMHNKDLALKIIPDTLPPRLAWQEFVGGLTTIDLRFNEALDADSVSKATFAITDANYRNSATDNVVIEKVKFIPPQDIRLTVSGVSEVCREWYKLDFSGVADKHGNILNNQKITIVEWLNSAGEICDKERKL
ncbi:MAG: DUF4012 domain-containing protein [Candidatus Gracilibacteria bacterium]|nr:DUF4012 domain-containing protein [Candidatus Gracilibacteria bacterium]MDD5179047.1 DUF4012 domain-containing protein [Candidatus Gracilibacteria bacterium]